MGDVRLLADVQRDADRVAYYTRFRAAMIELNAADFWGEVQRRIAPLEAAGHAEAATAVYQAAAWYAWLVGALRRAPAAWPLMVEALAQQRLEGGVDETVSEPVRVLTEGWVNAVLALLDALLAADRLLGAA